MADEAPGPPPAETGADPGAAGLAGGLPIIATPPPEPQRAASRPSSAVSDRPPSWPSSSPPPGMVEGRWLVRALYDFEAVNYNELTFRKDDVFVLLRMHPDDGWSEGEKDGQIGLFPSSYIRVLSRMVAVPVDPLAAAEADEDGDSSEAESVDMTPPTPAAAPAVPQRSSLRSIISRRSRPASRSPSSGGSAASGVAEVLLVAEPITSLLDEHGHWKASRPLYTVFVVDPEKCRKYSGVASYIVYTVKTSLGGPTVKRRFRHFVWLHERLCERYPFILMPPVPDKQVQGRFEAAFIERRRKQLERYMNRIALHPVLRSSPIVMQFLKATDLPEALFKGNAGRDGGEALRRDTAVSYLDRLQVPEPQLLAQSRRCVAFWERRARWHSNLQPTLDRFERFARAMATNLHLLQTCAERCHEHGADLLGEVGRLATTLTHLLASDESSSLVGRITDQLARITARVLVMSTLQAAARPVAGRPTRARSLDGTSPAPACWCWRSADCKDCHGMTAALSTLALELSRQAAIHNEAYSQLALSFKELNGALKRLRAWRAVDQAVLKYYESLADAHRTAQLRASRASDAAAATTADQLAVLQQRVAKAGMLIGAELEHFHRCRILDLRRAAVSFIEECLDYHTRAAAAWRELLPQISATMAEPVIL